MKTWFVVAGAMIATAAPAAFGDSVLINASDRGWVTHVGDTNGNGNYFAGHSINWYRNWFAFDLSGVSGSVTSATLVAFLDDTYGATVTGTYDLHGSSVALTDLLNRVGGVSLFEAMDDGAVIASIDFNPGMSGTQLSITFNSAGLDLLNAHLGGQVAFTGNVVDDFSLSMDNGVFGASHLYTPMLSLEFTPIGTAVPLPSAAGLGLTGLLGLGARRRR